MIESILWILGTFFALYLFLYASFIMVGSLVALKELYQNRRKKKMFNQIGEDFALPVSVVVPAYNEAQTILTTVDNLLLAEYKMYEIIIVDDASTDNTAQLVIEQYGLTLNKEPVRKQLHTAKINELYTGIVNGRLITLVRKDNGGNKADAVNAGINVSKYPYFVCMDADEILQIDGLKNAARVFLEDEDVIAVGGMIRVSNGIAFKEGYPVETRLSRYPIISIQRLEYNRAFMASRVFSDMFNGNLNISGGFGFFKKEPVLAVGGYDKNSVGEDMDLVMRLHNHYLSKNESYSIRYAPDAVCWTQAPFTLKDLGKQRARWHRGLIQTMWLHRNFFLNPKYKAVSLISFMYYFLYEFLSPVIELVGVFTLLLALLTQTLNWPFAIAIFVVYSLFSVLQTLIFYTSNFLLGDYKQYKGDAIRVFYFSIIDILFFRPYLLVIRVYATLTYRTKLHSWNKLTREEFKESSERQ